jgi:hypothetical protein
VGLLFWVPIVGSHRGGYLSGVPIVVYSGGSFHGGTLVVAPTRRLSRSPHGVRLIWVPSDWYDQVSKLVSPPEFHSGESNHACLQRGGSISFPLICHKMCVPSERNLEGLPSGGPLWMVPSLRSPQGDSSSGPFTGSKHGVNSGSLIEDSLLSVLTVPSQGFYHRRPYTGPLVFPLGMPSGRTLSGLL